MPKATSSTILISPPLAMRYLPAQSPFLVRPQLLTRISALPRTGLSRRLPAPIDRAWSPLEDVRVSAGMFVSQRFSKGWPLV
jgi:hypothetical protein